MEELLFLQVQINRNLVH